jgi:hypothetical protein
MLCSAKVGRFVLCMDLNHLDILLVVKSDAKSYLKVKLDVCLANAMKGTFHSEP